MIHLVCGLGRCGTSLVMQMLAHANCRVTGQYPAYEDPIASQHFGAPEAWANYNERVVKVVGPHAFTPPAGLSYCGVWIDRDVEEQARSQIKFLRAMGVPADANRKNIRAFVAGLRSDRMKSLATLHRLKAEMTFITFEDLLQSPRLTAKAIAGAMGAPIDIERMIAVVRPRSPTCFPGMLEAELMRPSMSLLQ